MNVYYDDKIVSILQHKIYTWVKFTWNSNAERHGDREHTILVARVNWTDFKTIFNVFISTERTNENMFVLLLLLKASRLFVCTWWKLFDGNVVWGHVYESFISECFYQMMKSPDLIQMHFFIADHSAADIFFHHFSSLAKITLNGKISSFWWMKGNENGKRKRKQRNFTAKIFIIFLAPLCAMSNCNFMWSSWQLKIMNLH